MNEVSPPATVKVIGTALAATDYSHAVALLKHWAAAPSRAYTVAAAATHLAVTARRYPDFRRELDSFDVVFPDGMPLVWVMNRRLAEPMRDRVYGPTLMLRCLAATAGPQWKHFFLGATNEILDALQRKMEARFPGLQVAGVFSPPFGAWSEALDAEMIERIRASGAQFVWVGLGAPKQEKWLARLKPQLPPAVYGAVGAAFAFHAGFISQAPPWMQRRGLEWLFRLLSEPRRLWKRYAVYNSLYLWYVFWDGIRGR